MTPSARDTARVVAERRAVIEGAEQCPTMGNRHTRCERLRGHTGAHYAMCGVKNPVHVRWPSGRTWALYPRQRSAA